MSRSFAERLAHLRQVVHPNSRGPYTFEEVAEGASNLGFAISAAYVWHLERGTRDNPTLRHIEGLAAFFGVPAAYFLDDQVEARVRAELDLVARLRDKGVQDIALRTGDMSADSLETMQTLLAALDRLDGES